MTWVGSLQLFLRRQAPIALQVLIHAGTGGVGQAAAEVCSALGAAITATAGSAQKRTFLRAAGVFAAVGSRDASFVDAIAVRGAVKHTRILLLPGHLCCALHKQGVAIGKCPEHHCVTNHAIMHLVLWLWLLPDCYNLLLASSPTLLGGGLCSVHSPNGRGAQQPDVPRHGGCYPGVYGAGGPADRDQQARHLERAANRTGAARCEIQSRCHRLFTCASESAIFPANLCRSQSSFWGDCLRSPNLGSGYGLVAGAQ